MLGRSSISSSVIIIIFYFPILCTYLFAVAEILKTHNVTSDVNSSLCRMVLEQPAGSMDFPCGEISGIVSLQD